MEKLEKLFKVVFTAAVAAVAVGVVLVGVKYKSGSVVVNPPNIRVTSPVTIQDKNGNQEVLGSGNISFQKTVQKADICTVSASNTTTICSFYNDNADGSDRIIDSVVLYSDSLSFVSGNDISVGTSTSATAAHSKSAWGVTALASSTSAGHITTTTLTAAQRLWAYGTYLNATTTNVATTTGFLKVLYDNN